MPIPTLPVTFPQTVTDKWYLPSLGLKTASARNGINCSWRWSGAILSLVYIYSASRQFWNGMRRAEARGTAEQASRSSAMVLRPRTVAPRRGGRRSRVGASA